jgi:glycosyltransferase involved in cell wall biosynthesis
VHVGFALLTLFPGRIGGSETNVRGLLGEFAAGTGPKRVTVLANRYVAHDYAGFERGPVGLHCVRSYRSGDSDLTRLIAMTVARALPRRTARDVPAGLDLVHYPVTVPIPASSAPRVVTVYDVQHHDLPGFFSRAERRYRRWAYDSAGRNADVVVTTSAFTADRLAEVVGVNPERIQVVYMGIDRTRFSPERGEHDELLAGLNLPQRFVVYPANLWPHKNHARLLEALASLRDRELSLVLTGQAYGRLPQLLARARRLGLERRVHHLGYVTAEAVPPLYRRAQAMVFPSLYEGFGTPPLEAMACGCPVAASARGSLGEVCGDAALVFDPQSPDAIAEAVDRVVSEPALRERLRADGLSRAADFTWRAAAEGHIRVYERALAERTASTPRP